MTPILFLTIKRLPSFPETGGENNRSLWVVKYVKRQISSGCQAFILVPALSFQSSNRFMVKYFIGWKMCNEIRDIQTWFLTELVLYPWNEKYIRNVRMKYSCALCIWEHKLFSIYSQPAHCWGTVFRLEHMANTNGPYRTVSQCCELPEPKTPGIQWLFPKPPIEMCNCVTKGGETFDTLRGLHPSDYLHL